MKIRLIRLELFSFNKTVKLRSLEIYIFTLETKMPQSTIF